MMFSVFHMNNDCYIDLILSSWDASLWLRLMFFVDVLSQQYFQFFWIISCSQFYLKVSEWWQLVCFSSIFTYDEALTVFFEIYFVFFCDELFAFFSLLTIYCWILLKRCLHVIRLCWPYDSLASGTLLALLCFSGVFCCCGAKTLSWWGFPCPICSLTCRSDLCTMGCIFSVDVGGVSRRHFPDNWFELDHWSFLISEVSEE